MRPLAAHHRPRSGIAGALFWIYTFYWISKLPPGDGAGFQWIAEVPLSAVFNFLTLPAILSIMSRTGFAAMSGVLSVTAFAVLWLQLTAEFTH